LVDEDEVRLLNAVRGALRESAWVIAASGFGNKERLLPISEALVARLRDEPAVDLLAIEADGSAMRAFKAPAGHEPAVPPSATLVVVVVGADIFGRPLTEELVHRPERVSALTGLRPGDSITPEAVATVLGHRDGGRKAVPAGARFAALINKVNDERMEAAREAGTLLLRMGVPLVVLARVREDEPVVEAMRA
jgi:probable selenium-dependent hydroxylase accessory protein YqeC